LWNSKNVKKQPQRYCFQSCGGEIFLFGENHQEAARGTTAVLVTDGSSRKPQAATIKFLLHPRPNLHKLANC
jgi:hypothetical protein